MARREISVEWYTTNVHQLCRAQREMLMENQNKKWRRIARNLISILKVGVLAVGVKIICVLNEKFSRTSCITQQSFMKENSLNYYYYGDGLGGWRYWNTKEKQMNASHVMFSTCFTIFLSSLLNLWMTFPSPICN